MKHSPQGNDGAVRSNAPAETGSELILRAKRGLWDCHVFFGVTMCILAVTSAAKFITAAGNNPLLEDADPILSIPMRSLILIAACAEAGLLLYLGKHRAPNFSKARAVAWFGGILLIYKLLLWIRDPERPCNCLGWLGKWLFLSQRNIEIATTSIAAFFFVGGMAIMIGLAKSKDMVS